MVNFKPGSFTFVNYALVGFDCQISDHYSVLTSLLLYILQYGSKTFGRKTFGKAKNFRPFFDFHVLEGFQKLSPINAYPYDTQMPTIKIASTGYSTQKVQVGFNFDDDALYLEKIK